MAEPLTVLVDGDCGICARAGRWLARRQGIVVESIGSAPGARLLRDLTPAERYASVHVIDAAGRRRSSGAALPPIVRRLPGGRGPAALAAQLPGITEAVYRLVARHRRWLSRLAGLDACATGQPVDGSAHRRRRAGTVPSPNRR